MHTPQSKSFSCSRPTAHYSTLRMRTPGPKGALASPTYRTPIPAQRLKEPVFRTTNYSGMKISEQIERSARRMVLLNGVQYFDKSWTEVKLNVRRESSLKRKSTAVQHTMKRLKTSNDH